MGRRRHGCVRAASLLAAPALAVLVACGNGAAGPAEGGGDPVSPPAPSPPGSPPAETSNEIWVAPDGDDAADGTTLASAFATIARALREIGPGTVVHVRPGIYREALALEGVGGGDPIVLRGEVEQGERPVLAGERRRDFGLLCVECADLVVEGFEVRDYTDAGILVTLSAGSPCATSSSTATGSTSSTWISSSRGTASSSTTAGTS